MSLFIHLPQKYQCQRILAEKLIFSYELVSRTLCSTKSVFDEMK